MILKIKTCILLGKHKYTHLSYLETDYKAVCEQVQDCLVHTECAIVTEVMRKEPSALGKWWSFSSPPCSSLPSQPPLT